MKTKAVRLYGVEDLRLEEFELPEIGEDEILAKIVTDSICMSTWKLANQGANHKKTPDDIAENPIIVGHEFCGELVEVGSKWADKFSAGDRVVIQANLQLPDAPWCPGYSYRFCGGDATYIVLPNDVMKQDCLIPYNGETWFEGALLEPLSCVISAFNASYHLVPGTYDHNMGIKEGGNMLIMGGTGPMGLLAIDYALHGPRKPAKLVVTDIDQAKLDRAAALYPSENGVEVHYVNTSEIADQVEELPKIVGGKFDDIFCMLAIAPIVTDGSRLLAADGCFNFFAGPQDKNFMAPINFYDMHYSFVHYVGTSGGNTDDIRAAVKLVEEKKVHVANVVTHVLGLDACPEVTLEQKKIGGGKKLVYTQKSMDLTELAKLGEDSELGRILAKTNGVWSKEAEDYLLANQSAI